MRKVIGFALCLFSTGFVCAQVPQIERDALIALYNATDGANWTNDTNWRNAGDTDFNDVGTECTWYGVTCADGTNVTNLSFQSNLLTGQIPPELENLSNLQELRLENNQLSGSIPAELGNLLNLETLILSSNQLSGDIPPEMGQAISLKYLSLRSNNLTGSIPPELGNLSNLQTLNLSANFLDGEIPSELGNLTSLSKLFLSNNRLRGSIPPELGSLSLFQLDLSNNQLTGLIPASLGNLNNLVDLFLNENQLTGSIPPELSGLSHLSFLYLNNNQLSGPIPSEFGIMSVLVILDLQANQLSGSIPVEISNLTGLFWGHIDYNALWTDDPAVQDFLDWKAGEWDESQTIAPADLTVASVGDRTVWLEWTPILYTDDHGGYEVFSELVGGAAFNSGGFTDTKQAVTFPVTGLTPGEAYDFTVKTFTRAHPDNPQNTVVSDPTDPIMATTSDTGCAAPQITVSDDYPYTLTASVHDTWEWSIGETTQSIEVRPHWPSWYWVATTEVGGCAEAAVTFVGEDLLFADDIESGDFSFWTDVSP